MPKDKDCLISLFQSNNKVGALQLITCCSHFAMVPKKYINLFNDISICVYCDGIIILKISDIIYGHIIYVDISKHVRYRCTVEFNQALTVPPM